MLISLHINFLSNNTNYKLNVIIFIKKISDTHYFGQRARSVIPNWPFPRPSTQRARDETLTLLPPFHTPHPFFRCAARPALLLDVLLVDPKSTSISSSGH